MYLKFRELITRMWDIPLESMNRISTRILNSSIALITALLFLYIFKPFGFEYWIESLFSPQWIAPIFIIIIAIGVISLSLLASFFIFKYRTFKLRHLILSIFCESLTLTLILAILSLNDATSLWQEITTTFVMVLTTMSFCYFISFLIILPRTKEDLNHISDSYNHHKNEFYSLRDDSGQLRLSVRATDIIMFKSEDNYVEVHYIMEGKLTKHLIRKRLKEIENETHKLGFIKCHRSYLINQSSILRIEKTGRSYSLTLNYMKENIPISRSFQDQLLSYAG